MHTIAILFFSLSLYLIGIKSKTSQLRTHYLSTFFTTENTNIPLAINKTQKFHFSSHDHNLNPLLQIPPSTTLNQNMLFRIDYNEYRLTFYLPLTKKGRQHSQPIDLYSHIKSSDKVIELCNYL